MGFDRVGTLGHAGAGGAMSGSTVNSSFTWFQFQRLSELLEDADDTPFSCIIA